MKKYEITGQVFLADGFTWVIEAESLNDARRVALDRARQCTWSEAEIQEVCINSTLVIVE